MAIVDLSILIVSFNTRALTLDCLKSVFQETHQLEFEVLVVDNASEDGSAKAIAANCPQVQLIAMRQNLGFAAANNVAVSHARGEWLLLLNPDTVILAGAIQKLVAFARAHPEASIFGGRTLFPDGTLNASSCWGRPTPWSCLCRGVGLATVFKDNRWFDPEALGGWRRDSVREVDIVTGCFLLIRRNLWEQLGGFDPAFFMYAEEADLCLRARARGLKCLICPDATIIHYGGASEKVRAEKLVRLFRATAQLFARHWTRPAAAFGRFTLDLWAVTRTAAFGLARLLRPRYQAQFETWRAVLAQRAEWHLQDEARGAGW